MNPQPWSVIERREYKYLVDEETAARVRACIRPFCEVDAHARGRPGFRYVVESLYLDTPDLALFRANEHEVPDRFKLRIRTYPASHDAPLFFEVKRRVGDVITKSRGRILGDWRGLLDGRAGPGVEGGPSGKARVAVERFVALAKTLHVRPVALVRYERESYVSTVDSYARVTLDRAISCQKADRLSFDSDPLGWRFIDLPENMLGDRSLVVLEMKFTTAVPFWMVATVRKLDLTRRAFSKYGSAVMALYGRLDPSEWVPVLPRGMR